VLICFEAVQMQPICTSVTQSLKFHSPIPV